MDPSWAAVACADSSASEDSSSSVRAWGESGAAAVWSVERVELGVIWGLTEAGVRVLWRRPWRPQAWFMVCGNQSVGAGALAAVFVAGALAEGGDCGVV